jgi:trk system potassium uptake protein TrkA
MDWKKEILIMRVVFVGAGEVTARTAEFLIGKGHEVVIIDKDSQRLEALSDHLDCSFLNGDGSTPAILREVSPEKTDVLLGLTDDDQDNLIASLVGRSLGFKRVITSIQNPEFEEICRELELEHTILPSRTISRYLADMIQGIDIMELSTILKDTARFFTFAAEKGDAGTIEALELPATAKVVCYYRGGRFYLAKAETKLKKGDEVVVLTDIDTVPQLKERWSSDHSGKRNSQ